MILAPSTALGFDDFVDRLVREAAHAAPTFPVLLSRLPGVSPADALLSLRRLARRGAQFPHLEESALAVSPPVLPLDQGAGLPLPHPLDMEWRFTRDSAGELLQAVLDDTKPGDAVLLLGVPTVAASAVATGSDRVFQVVGEGNVICRSLELATAGDGRFEHGDGIGRPATAAVIDPPWYLDAYVDMLSTCSRRTADGAHVLLVLPPPGVRPTAVIDRRRMIEAAFAAGFDVDDRPELLRYRSPLFEIAAWRAAGIGAWLPDWRTGELVRLVKRRPPSPHPAKPANDPSFELTFDGARFKLLLNRKGPEILDPIVEGGILPSVSARFPARDRASLWTTSNGAFAIDSSLALAALRELAIEREIVLPPGLACPEFDCGDTATVDAVRELTHDLSRLAEREIAIAERLVGKTAWLRGLNDARFSGAPWRASQPIRRGAAA